MFTPDGLAQVLSRIVQLEQALNQLPRQVTGDLTAAAGATTPGGTLARSQASPDPTASSPSLTHALSRAGRRRCPTLRRVYRDGWEARPAVGGVSLTLPDLLTH